MRELPILMSGPLVRAVLSGQKTQTRRPFSAVFNSPPDLIGGWFRPGEWKLFGQAMSHFRARWYGTYPSRVRCPFGKDGDRLWVRETFAIVHPCRDMETGYIDDIRQPTDIPKDNGGGFWVPWYRADWNGNDDADRGFKWAPSIHMPRWASRITLPLVSVRVERVQDISEADAWAEGYGEHWQRRVKEAGADGPLGRPDACGWFAMLWDKLYGTWGQNPWVAVYEWGQIEVSR